MQLSKFQIDAGLKVVLNDLKIDLDEVLKRAQLPGDLFNRKDVILNTSEFLRLWNGTIATANNPDFPLILGKSFSTEAFHPAFFAALCCPNLNVAMSRLVHLKPLVGPVLFKIIEGPLSTTITIDCINANYQIPDTMIAFELVFIVHLVRIATRNHIEPLKIRTINPMPYAEKYHDYFGVTPVHGNNNSITFTATDANMPFITLNGKMWDFFEPELRKRLSNIKAISGFTNRVQSSLLELLPGGQNSIDDVAKMLMVSKRTLQRRLKEESTTFQTVLNRVREKLAKHYLESSDLSGAQISFLLGFEDPNSFVRAFHSWTGKTPMQLRPEYDTQSTIN